MNSGIHKVQPNGATGEEWFQTDLATVMSAIKAVKDGKHSITPSGKTTGTAITPIVLFQSMHIILMTLSTC